MKMSEMNGYEVLELLCSSNTGNVKDIPVVVATASGRCDAEELKGHSFAVCLFEPFSLKKLMAITEKKSEGKARR